MYDLLECIKRKVLQNNDFKISMTGATVGYLRGVSVGVQVELIGQQGKLCDTLQFPMLLGWVKRCQKKRRSKVRFLFVCFVFSFWGVLGVHAAGVKGDYGGTGRWMGLECMMWKFQRCNKELCLLQKRGAYNGGLLGRTVFNNCSAPFPVPQKERWIHLTCLIAIHYLLVCNRNTHRQGSQNILHHLSRNTEYILFPFPKEMHAFPL